MGVGTLAMAPAVASYFAEVTVSPAYRRRGIGTSLVTALQRVAEPGLPILGRAMPSHPLRGQFLHHLGATVLVETPMPRLDATDPAVPAWAVARAVPEGYRITALDQVDDDSAQTAWTEYFTWAHAAFGVVRPEAVPGTWAPLREGLHSQASKVCLDCEERVVGFSLVSPDAWEGRTFIVCETTSPDQPDGQAIVAAALAGSLTALAAMEKKLVEVEGHTTVTHIPALFDTLPTNAADPMTIYQLPLRPITGPAAGNG